MPRTQTHPHSQVPLTIPLPSHITLLIIVPLQAFWAIVDIRRPGFAVFVHGAADERGARRGVWVGAVFGAHAVRFGYVGFGAGEIWGWGLSEDDGWEGEGEDEGEEVVHGLDGWVGTRTRL